MMTINKKLVVLPSLFLLLGLAPMLCVARLPRWAANPIARLQRSWPAAFRQPVAMVLAGRRKPPAGG